MEKIQSCVYRQYHMICVCVCVCVDISCSFIRVISSALPIAYRPINNMSNFTFVCIFDYTLGPELSRVHTLQCKTT